MASFVLLGIFGLANIGAPPRLAPTKSEPVTTKASNEDDLKQQAPSTGPHDTTPSRLIPSTSEHDSMGNDSSKPRLDETRGEGGQKDEGK